MKALNIIAFLALCGLAMIPVLLIMIIWSNTPESNIVLWKAFGTNIIGTIIMMFVYYTFKEEVDKEEEESK